jgi:hypothetical protein
MRERVKKKWLEALRSGKYKKAKYALVNGDGYCCLGVLCDLHAKETGRDRPKPDQPYMGQTTYLPADVVEWAGLPTYAPTVRWKDHPCVGLDSLNDGGSLVVRKPLTFKQIAKYIEEQL